MRIFSGFVLPGFKTFCPAIAAFYVFCQVIGIMCPVPQMGMAGDTLVIVEAMLLCPMNANVTCAPGVISSPDRQEKSPLQKIELDHGMPYDAPNSCSSFPSQGMISPSKVLTYIPTPLDVTPGVLRN
jgi:hypothetical protein